MFVSKYKYDELLKENKELKTKLYDTKESRDRALLAYEEAEKKTVKDIDQIKNGTTIILIGDYEKYKVLEIPGEGYKLCKLYNDGTINLFHEKTSGSQQEIFDYIKRHYHKIVEVK